MNTFLGVYFFWLVLTLCGKIVILLGVTTPTPSPPKKKTKKNRTKEITAFGFAASAVTVVSSAFLLSSIYSVVILDYAFHSRSY